MSTLFRKYQSKWNLCKTFLINQRMLKKILNVFWNFYYFTFFLLTVCKNLRGWLIGKLIGKHYFIFFCFKKCLITIISFITLKRMLRQTHAMENNTFLCRSKLYKVRCELDMPPLENNKSFNFQNFILPSQKCTYLAENRCRQSSPLFYPLFYNPKE